jgi:microcin C transport system ATP-binding protein
MSDILSVDQLSISFHQGKSDTHIVKSISFAIPHNKTVALVGESGSGKSLTAHAIMRLLPYPTAFHPSGSITFEGRDLLTLPLKKMTNIRGNDIGMIFQEPMSALNPLHTVERQIGEALKIHQANTSKVSSSANSMPNIKSCIKEQVLVLLNQVKIQAPEPKLNAYPHQLSGGQRQRVMIAMALANRPKLLIADEPTTALDVTVQKDILDLLRELQTIYQMSVLLITHDLGVVKYMADHVLVMNKGEIIEEGCVDDILQHPKNEYTQQLVNSHPSGDPVTLPAVISDLPLLLSTQELNVKFPLSKPLFGRCKSFFYALHNVSMSLRKGTTHGVLGESGSGKSTLALAILRLIQSDGSIQFDNNEVSTLDEKTFNAYRREMQIVFQDPFSSLSPRMSVKQIISEGLHLQGDLTEEVIDQKVSAIILEVGLDPTMLHRYPHEFSGGQRQRIAIARALVLDPRLLFLDEPTSALDRTVQMQVINLLRKLQKERQLSYIFISHDIHVVKALSHDIIVIKDGEIVEYGNANQLLSNPSHAYTKKLLEATL